MNSTQYLIILITAVVCFCIFVLVDIARMRKRENEMRAHRNPRRSVGNHAAPFQGDRSAVSGLRSPKAATPQPLTDYELSLYAASFQRQRLQEEIRTRLEGGDGA